MDDKQRDYNKVVLFKNGMINLILNYQLFTKINVRKNKNIAQMVRNFDSYKYYGWTALLNYWVN